VIAVPISAGIEALDIGFAHKVSRKDECTCFVEEGSVPDLLFSAIIRRPIRIVNYDAG